RGAGRRGGARTGVSLVASTRPEGRLFPGRMLLVDDDPPVAPLADGPPAGSFESLALRGLPPRLLPYAHVPTPCGQPNCPPGARLRAHAEKAMRLPVTCLAGPAEVLARFLALCPRERGWSPRA